MLVLNLDSYLFTYEYKMDVDGLSEDSLHSGSTSIVVRAPYLFEESSIAFDPPKIDLAMANYMLSNVDAKLEVPWLIYI